MGCSSSPTCVFSQVYINVVLVNLKKTLICMHIFSTFLLTFCALIGARNVHLIDSVIKSRGSHIVCDSQLNL